MTECIRHPQTGAWTPVEEVATELWQRGDALGDTIAEALADQDERTAVLAARIDTVTSQMQSQQADIDVLRNRLTVLEKLPAQLDALTAEMAELTARIDAMPKPDPTGPAFGVDVSGHQTLDQVKAAAADPANAFVIVKATEGETWKSPDYAAQVGAVRAADKMGGAYHFAWCNQDALKESVNFIAGAAPKPGEIVALDLERETAGETWTVRVAYALAWLDNVKAKTGATPLVYVNWNWIKGLRTAATQAQWDRLVKYPLWLAEWTKVAGQHSTVSSKDGTNPDSWPIVVHQYGVIDSLDRNWTPDIAKLRALCVPA